MNQRLWTDPKDKQTCTRVWKNSVMKCQKKVEERSFITILALSSCLWTYVPKKQELRHFFRIINYFSSRPSSQFCVDPAPKMLSNRSPTNLQDPALVNILRPLSPKVSPKRQSAELFQSEYRPTLPKKALLTRIPSPLLKFLKTIALIAIILCFNFFITNVSLKIIPNLSYGSHNQNLLWFHHDFSNTNSFLEECLATAISNYTLSQKRIQHRNSFEQFTAKSHSHSKKREYPRQKTDDLLSARRRRRRLSKELDLTRLGHEIISKNWIPNNTSLDEYFSPKKECLELRENFTTIPKIIHQTYKSMEELPERWKETADAWKYHHPDWQYIFWSDADLRWVPPPFFLASYMRGMLRVVNVWGSRPLQLLLNLPLSPHNTQLKKTKRTVRYSILYHKRIKSF